MAKFRPSIELKQELSERAGGRCEYCRSPELFSPQSFSVEHIIPRSLDGGNDKENLAFSCQGCNAYKSAKTDAIDPVTGRWVQLFNPRTQTWQDHFDWDENGLFIIGKTPTGRATAIRLKLNRDYVVNLRKLLVMAGEHPPK